MKVMGSNPCYLFKSFLLYQTLPVQPVARSTDRVQKMVIIFKPFLFLFSGVGILTVGIGGLIGNLLTLLALAGESRESRNSFNK